MKRIIFRAEGSSKIGMGHIMRCLALKQMLENTFEMTFALFEPDDVVKKLISGSGLSIITVPSLLDEIYATDSDAVVLDGYWYNNEYIRSIKNKDKKVIQIDDLIGPEFFADIVINHAIGVDYSKSKLDENTRLLTGSKYALLRKEFLNVEKTNRSFENLAVITLNMGGADPSNYTLKLLEAISGISNLNAEINILIGNSYAHKSKLTDWVNSHPPLKTKIVEGLNAGEIIDLFKKTSLFICPASTVVYEACATGVPTACFLTADNQINIYNGLMDSKAVLPMGDLQNMPEDILKSKLTGTFKNYKDFSVNSNHQNQLIDGQSGKRIKEAVLALWN